MTTLEAIVLIVLLVAAIYAGPWWAHSVAWGWTPIGFIVFLALILLVARALLRSRRPPL